MSSAVMPEALNASTITSVIMPTACLNTSRPSILRWPTVWVEDGPPSTYNFDLWRPSGRRCVASTARTCVTPDLRPRTERDGPRPVAEQHAGAAVVPVQNSRQRLSPDHERAAECAAAQKI